MIRAYQLRLLFETRKVIPATLKAAEARAKKIKGGAKLEHGVPVRAIMTALAGALEGLDLESAVLKVREVIDGSTFLAYVTPEEDKKLHPHRMPDDAPHPWADPWARYRAAGIPIPA